MITSDRSSSAIDRELADSNFGCLQLKPRPRLRAGCRRAAVGFFTMLLLVVAVSSRALAQQEKPPGESWQPNGHGGWYRATSGQPTPPATPTPPNGKPDLTNIKYGDNVSIDDHTSIQRLDGEWEITSTNCEPNTVPINDSDVKKKEECRLDRADGKPYVYEIEYAEYSCQQPPLLRRIVLSWKKTAKACTLDNYKNAKLDARKYEESDTEWPDPPVTVPPPPPPPPPPPSSCATPLRVRPITIVQGNTGDGVVWEDELGNQYKVNYHADGTTEGFPGTPPPRPAPSDISKWQIPPDIQKQLEKIKDTAKELQKILADPDEASRILKEACDTSHPPVLAVPEQPTKPETPKETRTTKRPRKEATTKSKTHARRDTGTTSPGPAPAPAPGVGIGIGIGIGIPIGGLRGHGGGRDSGGGSRTSGSRD
jgi:hypothetical protein